jgi:hypothetical protein
MALLRLKVYDVSSGEEGPKIPSISQTPMPRKAGVWPFAPETIEQAGAITQHPLALNKKPRRQAGGFDLPGSRRHRPAPTARKQGAQQLANEQLLMSAADVLVLSMVSRSSLSWDG